MAWFLAEHLRYAQDEGGGIFLCLSSQRYFTLPRHMTNAVNAALKLHGDCDEHKAQIADLTSAGILVTDVGRAPAPMVLRATYECEPRGASSYRLMLRLAFARLHAKRALRHCFAAAVQTLAEDPPSPGDQVDNDVLMNIARSDQSLNYFTPSRDRCLPHSLAFVRVCRSRGIAAQLILGVISRPFSAHAWAQDGERVLNDSLENVRRFTPIAAWP